MDHAITHRVGDIELSVLTDGASEFGAELFPSTDPAHVDALLKAHGETAVRTNFNAVLARTGGRTVLIDAGPRDLFGPACGHLHDGLAEVGVTPEEVDTIFFTHLHPDHIAGTITAEGRPVFPNAELVVTEGDRAFWSNGIPNAPETLQQWQQLAQAVLAAYGDRLRVIEGEAEIAPGVTALPLPGHTPGHSGYRVSSGGGELVHVGDIVHAPHLQLQDPEIAVAFDIDADTARATRKRLLDQLAADGALVTGGHLLRPAIGRVVREGQGYGLERA
ncbi:MBL fold metallo-hydrolase [Wenxinia marina]|uniref:Zn-dependent hydrolase n=1 Tax=Wenxinia marina DSM 24838 TaxID=1123501 RepID=A0A0D0Q0T4_9RHOB|nr:MBL fold metallo-hydrolase [Wenxinia marina]KIQ68159.1 Zn-dependent hydrolase [Wenxinia marina DSM 24838]GGL76307.1 MBL fold metallo-hydrolase [Wenxinia marina]